MMPRSRLVVVGTSAGGLDALRQLVSALPADFAAPVAVVMHTAPESPGLLHEILDRAGRLPALSPRQSERLEPGLAEHAAAAHPSVDHATLLERARELQAQAGTLRALVTEKPEETEGTEETVQHGATE